MRPDGQGLVSQRRMSRRFFLKGAAMLAAGLTLPVPAGGAVGAFEPFAFAFVSDVHLATGMPDSYKLVHESQLFLQDLVRQLNRERLDFVIFGGDQVEVVGRDEANWQLFLDIVQGLNCPWNFILGEHDVTDTFPVDKMRTYGPDWKGKGVESDRSYWSQNPLSGIHIIGLDTSRPNSPSGDMGRKQLDWLKKDLEWSKLSTIIVFSHHPLLPPPPYDGGPPWDEYIMAQGGAVREVLNSSPKVRLAVSGHLHTSKIQREKDIWYVSCPSLDVYPCAYRIFRMAPDAITIETRQVEYPALLKKARKALADSPLAYKYDPSRPELFVELCEGEHIDNDVLLPLIGSTTPQPMPRKKKKKGAKPEKKPDKKAREKKKAGERGKTDEPGQKAPATKAPPEPASKAPDQAGSGQPQEFEPATSDSPPAGNPPAD